MGDKCILFETNEFQTPVTTDWLGQFPSEVQDQFMEFMGTVPLLKYMASPGRKRAGDLERDKFGRIIVDPVHPHILEDMDYFRPAAKFYDENGCYTFLKPNPNPNSEFGKWYTEEVRRCRDGYVRESDGEWVTGLMYFYLNYSPIMLNRFDDTLGIYNRIPSLPDFWEGIYYRFHSYYTARILSKHVMELARRGASKSYGLASVMAHNLILGENSTAKTGFATILTAYLKEYLSDKDGTFSKFTPILDYCAENTEFPRLMYKNSPSDMIWRMGYKTPNGNIRGSKNAVMGLSVKDDSGKIRGKRGYILFEEIGSYPNFKDVYNTVQESVKEGDHVFSEIIGVGTAGDEKSDFTTITPMLYNPDAFDLLAFDNVYDQVGTAGNKFVYFFPAYISRAGCMDKDGNSDVTKALMQILMNRYKKRKTDPSTILRTIAEMPITPKEALMKTHDSVYPVAMVNERLRQIDQNPRFYDDVYTGQVLDVGGHMEFRSTPDIPIHEYGVSNKMRGAVEIFEMPQDGDIPRNRYIVGVDPVDQDQADSSSLFSCFVFDLFTDRIVAEYTGRQPYADDNYDIVWKLCEFYNARCMYENNKRGMYPYFAKRRSLWRLADCPEYLRERELVKYSTFGSSSKGINMTNPSLIAFANDKILEWLNKTVDKDTYDESGELHTEHVPNLFFIKSRALLQEMVAFGPNANTDRISALMQVMLYREEYIIKYGGLSDVQDNVAKKEDEMYKVLDKDWERQQMRNRKLYGR